MRHLCYIFSEWLTDVLTGIDHTSMNLGEFFIWLPKYVRIENLVTHYVAPSILLAITLAIAIVVTKSCINHKHKSKELA